MTTISLDRRAILSAEHSRPGNKSKSITGMRGEKIVSRANCFFAQSDPFELSVLEIKDQFGRTYETHCKIHTKYIDRLEQTVGCGKSDRAVKGLTRLKFAIMITPAVFICIEDFAQIPFSIERHGIM